MVPSPSGKAAACKAAIPGSNPGGTSTLLTLHLYGDLAELVECTGLENRRGSHLPGFESLGLHHHNLLNTYFQNCRFTSRFILYKTTTPSCSKFCSQKTSTLHNKIITEYASRPIHETPIQVVSTTHSQTAKSDIINVMNNTLQVSYLP